MQREQWLKVCPSSSLIPHWPQVLCAPCGEASAPCFVAILSRPLLRGLSRAKVESEATVMAMKSAQARETKTCGQCGIREDQGETFNHCSRCKVVAYCSKACQKQHWRGGHKDTCQAASEREDTVKKAANKTVDDDVGPSKVPGKKKPKPNCSY